VHDSANREFDLVDGAGNTDVQSSDAYLIDNKIHKSDTCTGNRNVIHFGKDGDAHHNGTLYLVRNQIRSQYTSAIVDISDGKGVHFHENTIEGPNIKLYTLRAPDAQAFGCGNTLPASCKPALLSCTEQHRFLSDPK
jgi:hypothetical protein